MNAGEERTSRIPARPLFRIRPAVIGMIHLGALPGTPFSRQSVAGIISQAIREAVLYGKAGVDAILIENMHDRPYLKGAVGPEIVAMMTRVASEVRQKVDLPCGVQILAGANEEALAVALAAGLQFVRVEGFVFAHVADEGWIDGCAGRLLRERARWGATGIALWTDIKKKHSSHAVTADISLGDTAKAAVYNGSDALVITGGHTGEPTDAEDLALVRRSTPEIPLYIGSGVTAENVHHYAGADGYIVGSSLKEQGYWENAVDRGRVDKLLEAVAGLRARSEGLEMQK